MKKISELKKAVTEGLKLVKKHSGIIEAQVYASSNRRTVGRIAFMTHIPSNGLEEPKSDEDFGIAVEVWFQKGGKKLFGVGHEASDLSLDGVKRAFEKAVRDGVEDKEFAGFIKKKDFGKQRRKVKKGYHDKKIIDLDPQKEAKLLSDLSWETIKGAVDTITPYAKKQKLDPKRLSFILGGDNFIMRERMALATTNGISETDESTVILSFITAMLEKDNAKGSAWGATSKLPKKGFAYKVGKKAAQAAIKCVGGTRVKTGKYKVVFGHQAVTELFANLLVPHLNLAMVDFGATVYRGRYGQKIASENLTIYDDGTIPNAPGTKRVTDEGVPASKTMLINKGVLVGYLADSRTRNKILGKIAESTQNIGANPQDILDAIAPKNGWRFSRGGGRVAASGVGIYATNLVITSPKLASPKRLIKDVKDGIFIGRLWYTYPIGGYSSGIISGTAVADCFIIKNGKLTTPILPNTLRLQDNIAKMAKNITGIANNQTPTILWASDEITQAPWVAIDDVQFYSINLPSK